MKKYIIQPNSGGYGILAGSDNANRQILAGIINKRLFMLTFDKNGNFLELKEKILDIGQDPDSTLINWLNGFGYKMDAISVQKFYLPEYQIGIQDSPYEDDEELDEEEYQMYLDWEETGLFVLFWGKDFWYDIAGNINST